MGTGNGALVAGTQEEYRGYSIQEEGQNRGNVVDFLSRFVLCGSRIVTILKVLYARMLHAVQIFVYGFIFDKRNGVLLMGKGFLFSTDPGAFAGQGATVMEALKQADERIIALDGVL